MNWALVLPGLCAVSVGLTAGRLQRRLRPPVAVKALTVLAGMSAVAVVASLAALSFGFAAQLPWVVDHVGWCRTFARSHDSVPLWIGLTSTAALLAMAVAMVRSTRRRRQTLAQLAGPGPGVEVLSTSRPLAFAVPGRPGHIVVSQGMLVLLDEAEQDALFAHERSHLSNRHHLYTAVAELAAAAIPMLRSLAAQVRYATERWADEDAAAEVGDRRLVARAIARAALAGNGATGPGALALGDHGVVGRVEALLSGSSVSSPVETAVALGLGGVLVAVISSSVQVHHLLAFAAHVCSL